MTAAACSRGWCCTTRSTPWGYPPSTPGRRGWGSRGWSGGSRGSTRRPASPSAAAPTSRAPRSAPPLRTTRSSPTPPSRSPSTPSSSASTTSPTASSPQGIPPALWYAARGLPRLPRLLPLRPQGVSKSKWSVRWARYLSSLGFDMPVRISSNAFLDYLIYSEMLKTLRLYGLLDFNVEIFFPHDLNSLPRGYDKHKSKLCDEPHIMTSKSLLVEILKTLKDTFWSFQSNQSSSLFFNAVAANHHGPGNVGDNQARSHGNISAMEMAAAKAAQHRLMRGVWTNVRFGDMQRALAGWAASEQSIGDLGGRRSEILLGHE